MVNIKIDLSSESIDKAIKEIEKYKKKIYRKSEEFTRRVAEEIGDNASVRFNNSIVNDLIDGTSTYADVDVSIDGMGNTFTVKASGKEVAFIEFGSGVYHNGSAGTSPHPKGVEMGVTIGSYGYGYGARKAWAYKEDGNILITRGTPSTMPMYRAMQDVKLDLIRIAKEVFND